MSGRAAGTAVGQGAALVVVGIGADGFDGLAAASRAELAAATVVYGSARQLALLDGHVTAERRPWPSPLRPALDALGGDASDGAPIHVLASGDPMLHGIGATLVARFGAAAVRVLPHVSSVTLACARIGWTTQDVEVISLVTADPATAVRRGGRAVVLSRDGTTPARLAADLVATGRGASRLVIAERLGAPDERCHEMGAGELVFAGGVFADLNVIAVTYLPDERLLATLPDDALVHDGQLTKQPMRAVTLAALAPRPGELLWDVGAGSGSISVEWCRAGRGMAAVAFERDPARRDRITANARAFGAAIDLRGAAPAAFDGAAAPDVVFIGGGLTTDGVLDGCLSRLPAGGRLVANAVTVESEAVLAAYSDRLGGDLARHQHHRAEPVGGMRGWRAAMPVTTWRYLAP